MDPGERPDGDLPFRQVAQHLPTPCWISDATGRIIWVNDAWLAYVGKDPEDLDREGLAVIHDPTALPEVRRRWAAARAAEEPDEMVFPLKGRDGAFRPFLTRVVPIRDGAGRVWRWFGTNTDISRQTQAEMRVRQTEAELRENEARLRLATEVAGVGVWEWRLDSNKMIYSPQARAICGFDPEGVVTYDMVVAATHPEDFPRTSAQAARALDPAVRDRSPYEYRIVRPDKEVRWVAAVGEAVFETGLEGRPEATRYVGTLIDVTARKLANDEIRESEHQLQIALRAGRMAAWRITPDGVIEPSPDLNRLIGLAPDARPTMEDLTPNYLPGELDRIAEAAAAARDRGERHFEVEYRYRRADGEVRWFNTRAEALVDEAGEAAGVVGIAMDVTDKKLSEERVRFLAREVDHRANNLMTVVESIIALSRGADEQELRDVLRGRVHALARTHQLLAESRWAGADLRRLASEELAPFSLGESTPRVRIEGPELLLSPANAQAVAMVLHELATNAAKYGALSCERGEVTVVWTVEPAGARIRWTETGGPPVSAPTRRGFGTSVIERALDGPAAGQVCVDWRAEGVACELLLPQP
ncbi:PAS domain-containing protein [Phenylobacterium sp.]|uniref:PAS domain-containing protein n=1 Tax=Phenylobacterium sp. TaxID=1871053 RepID=UPI0025D7A74E|nr:PAS domain-containing protein [Phenylobacterium sp.]